MELKRKTINFLGDSITEGVGASSPKNCYVSVFEKIAKLKKANNYGIGGTRIARKRVPSEVAKYDKDFMSRFPEMDKNADAVVVFGGTNDYGHGDAKLGTFESRDPYTFYGACHILFSGLSEMFCGKPVLVVTPIHRAYENVKDQNGHVLSDYVNVIREVAKYYSLPILDLYDMGGIQPAVNTAKERLVPDGLHPSDEGHRMIAERIKNFLERY